MNEIIYDEIDFGLIPKAAEPTFIEQTMMWYWTAVDTDIPVIKNNMFYENPAARDTLLSFINEIANYYYASNQNTDFDKDIFPQNLFLTDKQYNDRINFYFDAYNEYLELAFIVDVKKLLNRKSLFYIDDFQYQENDQKNEIYINKPILEVW